MIQKINYADKQTGGKFSASDANEIKSTVNLNADVLSENSQSILSLQGGQLGSIKPTDAAPTPARNGNYTFSIGGAKPAWLTAEAGITTVKAGDGVAVVYAAPSTYSYTHVNVSSEFLTIQKLKDSNYLLNSTWVDAGTQTPTQYFKIETNTGRTYKVVNDSEFFRVVFLDSNNSVLPESVTGLSTSIPYSRITTPNIPQIKYIRFQRLTGRNAEVCNENMMEFSVLNTAHIATNTANIATNTANLVATKGIVSNMKSAMSAEKTYINLMSNINSQQVFISNSVFLNPGYRLESSVVDRFARTANSFNYIVGHRVALLAKIKFESVTNDFIFQFGFHTSAFDKASPDYTAANFGLNNLTGTTQTFALIWDATKASNPLFYIYKSQVAAGQVQRYTILDFTVIDMGADSTNELHDKTTEELGNMFKNCTVLNGDIFYNDFIVKKAEEAMSITPDAVLKTNKNYGKKLVTIGDSLTANLIWQPKLQSVTGLQWSALETGTGIGYVNKTTGVYTTDDKSSDSNYRHAYKMAIGGTGIRPTSTDSIFIRSFDTVHYNPKIIFIYGGQNDSLSVWKTAGNLGTTTDEIVKNEIAYKTNAIDNSISVISAYKGMIENLMSLCPNAIIYLVTQMRVLGRVGMLDAGGNIRFPTFQSVVDWEMSERYPKVEYIRSIAKLYGLPLIDLWNDSGITDYNAESWYGEPSTDCTQVHPGTIGYYRMAEVMEKNL